MYSFKSKKSYSKEKFQLKLIDKRLKYLREQLKSIKKREIFYTTTNLLLNEQQTDNEHEYENQYKKRFHHLLNLYDKQMNNLNLWHFYRSDRIEQMYICELRQSNENFQSKKIDFKYELLSTLNDQRRCLQIEHENLNIHCRSLKSNEQSLVNQTNVQSLSTKESAQQSRPTYFLRRTVANENIPDSSSTTSLKDVSIFSRSQSHLLPSSGIELQCFLADRDIEQDVFQIQKTRKCLQSNEKQSTVNSLDNERTQQSSSIDVRIEDGRLWYKCAWFARNSPIILVFDGLELIPGLVLSVGHNDLLVRRSGTNIKHRISLSLLHDGHVAIRKRNCLF